MPFPERDPSHPSVPCLADLERQLETQNRELRASVERLQRDPSRRAVAVRTSDLEHLDELCRARPVATSSPRPLRGIRC
jgi:hypothetical protein